MNINTLRTNGALTVKLSGRLDSTTAGELDELLLRELTDDTAALTVDLEDVDFISSKGLRVLVSAYKRLNGREITLAGANSSVTELLRLSGLLKIFKTV